MSLEVGDLVACYITNTTEYESLMSWGVVLDINESLGDILVIDNASTTRWWPAKRWKLLSKKLNNSLDLPSKTV